MKLLRKKSFENDLSYLEDWNNSAQEFINFCDDILLYGGINLWTI